MLQQQQDLASSSQPIGAPSSSGSDAFTLVPRVTSRQESPGVVHRAPMAHRCKHRAPRSHLAEERALLGDGSRATQAAEAAV